MRFPSWHRPSSARRAADRPEGNGDAEQAAHRPAWPAVPGLAFGGDYNPEQWPQDVRLEDIELMGEAGVNLVSVGIFSWAMLEPREGEYDWGWLDETMDRLHAAGVGVALATATASPPPWLTHQHPEILPETADGTVLHPGARQAYSVSNPLYREYALAMTRAIATRYADHPALKLWHIDNELGCHVPHDYSDDAAAAFRRWLEQTYGDVEELNRAWGTAFWSQRYSDFAEILPPRTAPMFVNPAQQLDFARFSSDELLAHCRAMAEVLREITPGVPLTTNLMATSSTKWMDYFRWAEQGADILDVIATDHYTIAADDERHVELSFSADLTRGIAGGKPWMLMEHSTSAVNWQLHNRAKPPQEMLRNSLAHVARGADAVMFFQWRQSARGAEKHHSAMVPHAGTDTDVWRTTVRLGEILRRLEPVRGSRVAADVALVVDYEAWWAAELDSHPRNDVSYMEEVLHWYRALWRAGVAVDVVHPSTDLSTYRAAVVPTLHLVRDEHAARIAAAAEAGTQVLITWFSGIVDAEDAVRLGGHPGAFRELLGVRTEEFHPMQGEEVRALDDGTSASVWAEKTHLAGAEAVRRWAEGPLAGLPAVTRRSVGEGAAWYAGTRPDAAGLASLVDRLLADAGVAPVVDGAPAELEAVRRHGVDGASFLFLLNHSDAEVRVPVRGEELLSGRRIRRSLRVPAGEVAVVAER